MDYKKAGVDVQAGDALVEWLKNHQPERQPHQDKLISGLGGFSALFRADFAHMEEPCLVAGTDGVGTKLRVATHFESYQEVARDLVAMNVNDLVCVGATPLFFLDYYSCGQLDLEAAKDFHTGLQKACGDAGCALIGGETAEMPGVYQAGDFDCAGFTVGVVDRHQALGAHKVQPGDRLLGLASSGFHSNGYSLLRQVFAKDLRQWKEELLRPTALYVGALHKSLHTGGVRAAAHITGGGLNNLNRVLPLGTYAEVRAWEVPAPFYEVKNRSGMSWNEMLTTLNCGVGFIVVCAPEAYNGIQKAVQEEGFATMDLGRVEAAAEASQNPFWQFS